MFLSCWHSLVRASTVGESTPATASPHEVTYWQFHFAFLFPVLVVLASWQYWCRRPAPLRAWFGITVVACIALVYTTPWDNYLVWRGVWSYRPERVAVSWRIGYVPLEEYAFFILQPVLAGLCLWSFGSTRFDDWQQDSLLRRSWHLRLTGATVAASLGVAGALALAAGGRWLYAGLILVWSAPPLVLHWLYGETCSGHDAESSCQPLR